MKLLGIRFSDEQFKKIQEDAKLREMTLTGLLRDIINNYYKIKAVKEVEK